MEERREREEHVEREAREDVQPADVARVAGSAAPPPGVAAATRPDRAGPGASRQLRLASATRWSAQRSVLSNLAQSSWTAFAIACGVVRPARRFWNWFCSVVYIDGDAQSVYSSSPSSFATLREGLVDLRQVRVVRRAASPPVGRELLVLEHQLLRASST